MGNAFLIRARHRWVAAFAVAALVASGCASPQVVTYRPSREVTDSIPEDLARKELHRLLSTAGVVTGWVKPFAPEVTTIPLVVLDVGSDGFRVNGNGDVRSFSYLEVQLQATSWNTFKNTIFVRLSPGVMDEWTSFLFEENQIVTYPIGSREDVEMLFDALASLKAHSLARSAAPDRTSPAVGTPPAPDRVSASSPAASLVACPACRRDVSARAAACPHCGDPLR